MIICSAKIFLQSQIMEVGEVQEQNSTKEWRASAQQPVHDYATAPNICFVGITAHEDFRGNGVLASYKILEDSNFVEGGHAKVNSLCKRANKVFSIQKISSSIHGMGVAAAATGILAEWSKMRLNHLKLCLLRVDPHEIFGLDISVNYFQSVTICQHSQDDTNNFCSIFLTVISWRICSSYHIPFHCQSRREVCCCEHNRESYLPL